MSAPYITIAGGSYPWIAHYSGDANNSAVSSVCNDVNKNSMLNTPTPTYTLTNTYTPTATNTSTPTDTPSPTSTFTPTYTHTPTGTITLTPNLFDPPFDIKLVDDRGLPVLKWTMVWINNSNIVAVNSVVYDSIPVNSTYLAGSISCTDTSSITVTTLCYYEGPTLANPRGQIIWAGTLGPDSGVTDPALALNAIHISFNMTVVQGATSVQNDAKVDSDLNGDGDTTDPGEQNLVHAAARWNNAPIPATGFAPNRVTTLLPQNVSYADLGDLWLEIPRLGVQIPIVGVPQTSAGWDVSWLGEQAGWLNGTAFPTWSVNSVLTAHVYHAFSQPGPFVSLNKMWWNDQIIIHAWGVQYVYAVRGVTQVNPDALSSVIQHKDLPWMTRVTFRGYDPSSNSYKYRVVVMAVLVDVR